MASADNMSEQQVKNYIKGIITSNPLVSTIQTIQKDFREMIGIPIPFHKFGFNCLEHFLKNIPDTCVVIGTGQFAQVTLIPSKKSAHINEMVTQQKVNPKARRFSTRRKRGSMGFNPCNAPTMRRPLTRQPNNYSFTPDSSFSSSSSFGAPSPATLSKNTNNNTPRTQAAIQIPNNQITNATVRNTNVLNISSKSTSNQNTDSINIARRLLRGGIRTENTDEKRNYNDEQNKLGSKKVKERLDSLIHQQVKIGNVTRIPSTSPLNNQETEPLNNSKKNNLPHNAPILDQDILHNLSISDDEYDSQECSKDKSVEDAYFNKSKEKLNNLLYNFKNLKEEEEEDTSNVPKRVQCNLRTLISQFHCGIWCSDVPAHYRRLFRKELLYLDYGYTSLIEMCVSLKHIFHYVRPGTDDFKLYDRSKPLPDSVEKVYTIASYDVGEKVTSIEALPELDWADFKGHIPSDVFKYGNEIPNEFIPLDTKVESILDVVVVEIYDPSKFWFYLGTSENTPLDKLMDQMQTFYNHSEIAKEYAIPLGALREGLYCVQVIYGEYHRARIVRILADNPDYVRVLYIDFGTVCKAPVKGMCFLQTNFAELNAQAIRCRLANINPNMKGHPWPRTASDRFRELVNRRETKIKISYIDWKEEYVCVFLADVTDDNKIVYINETLVNEGHAVWDGEKNYSWPPNRNFRFVFYDLELVEKETVLFRDFRHSSDTFNPDIQPTLMKPSNFNYKLKHVIRKLKKTQIIPFVLSNVKCKVQNIHLFPTFLELEYGLAPNAAEMYSLEDMLVPLEFCLPQYFEPNEKNLATDDDDIEQMEISFMETVKNHRKFTPLNMVDVSTVINPSPIDFDIFGDLKEDMIEFCKSINLEADMEKKNEDELFCDAGEATGETLEHYKTLERNLEEFEPLRLIKQDKELSESIIEKLEKYNLLTSEHSSGSERGDGASEKSRNSAFCDDESEKLDLDWQAEIWPQELDNELSTIYEHSELDLNVTAPGSPTTSFFGFGSIAGRSRSDVNIFDNPEEFDNSSECSEKSETESRRSVSPESFLRTVERMSRNDLEEENDILEESNSTTENSSAANLDSENVAKFDINADLREAFKTFLESQKKGQQANLVSECSSEPSPNLSSSCEEPGYPGNRSTWEESFLNYNGRAKRMEDVNVEGRKMTNLTAPKSPKVGGSDPVLPFETALEDTRKSFVSTLSLNNPFRSYLESEEKDDHLATSGADIKDLADNTTLPDTDSTRSSCLDLLEMKLAEAETLSARNSDSEGSDYKVFVPKKNQNHVIAPSKDNSEPTILGSIGPRGICTPPRAATPPGIGTPRMFPPPAYPQVFPPAPYPHWSNGSGYPVPQYPSWSNGGNFPTPCMNYSQPREMLRPPPGFQYQCPPQNYSPYMPPRMGPVHGPPMPHSVYPQPGQALYYGVPRQMMTPPSERDFYERYNENILNRSKEHS